MSSASAEIASKAQQNCAGIVSPNDDASGLATAGGMVRITLIGGSFTSGALVNFTVAFMGDSGVGAIRAVSLRGLAGVA